MRFSIIIPTFENFNYLKITINSVIKNSKYDHEILVHVNSGNDETIDFLKKKNIKFSYSEYNLGLCTSTNIASKKATTDYILYSHDDMYFCPGWDITLKNEILNLNHNLYYLSSSMIEQNSGHIQFDCGDSFHNFNEDKLLKNYKSLKYFDYQGSHWAPHLIHKKIWNDIGGFSEEFNPGIGSDPDLNMKLWKRGVRIFKGLSNFKVYHFGSISLRKKLNLKINKGNKTFLKKWGITPVFFTKYYLRGGKFVNNKIKSIPFDGPLKKPEKSLSFLIEKIICKLKYLKLMIFK